MTNLEPKVSIGLPVFNSRDTVARAIESLLAQSCRDFKLVISDNASTDGTSEIIGSFAATDSRIVYLRQSRNVGAVKNFTAVLKEAAGPYFMFAAADDWWDPTFIAKNLEILEAHPDYAASMSQAMFEGSDISGSTLMGTTALTAETAKQNINDYLRKPAANTRFYALHRREIIQQSWIDEPFWAHDWAIVCRTLLHGKYHEIPEILMRRGAKGESSNAFKAIRTNGYSRVNQLFPYLRFAREVFKLPGYIPSVTALAHLVYVNLDGALMMLRKHSKLG